MENEAFSEILRQEGLRVCVCGGGVARVAQRPFWSMFRWALLEVYCKINAEVLESKYVIRVAQ